MEGQGRKHAPEDIAKRMKLQRDVFQTDAQIYRLQAEKLEKLQELVNLEITMYGGRISKNTSLIMEVENCEIMNGIVREISLWERIKDQDKAESGSVHGKLDQYKVDAKQQPKSGLKEKDGHKRETPEIG